MSSSMFIEPSSDKQEGSSNQNLIVVYGKNGVNIDPKDLEALIEEKAVQTISVIRITSPTPSMEDAEEAARIEAIKEAQDNADDTDDDKRREENSENKDKSSADTEDENPSSSDEHLEDNEIGSGSESDVKSEKPKRRGRLRRNVSKMKSKLQAKKQESKRNTEIVGLTLEGFYEADSAVQIAKEACKMAGIPYMQNRAEYELMLLVIRNDHCYTPFTSPEQMKAKIAADKVEAEILAATSRKLQPLSGVPSKQFNMKVKRPGITTTAFVSKKNIADDGKSKIEKVRVENKAEPLRATDEELEDESFELIDIEESDQTASDLSAESDNDRDSDLDFNVHNRHSKKRRVPMSQKKARRLVYAKMQDKRAQQIQEERAIPTTITASNNQSITSPAAATPKVIQLSKPRTVQTTLNVAARQIRHPEVLTVGKIGTTNSLNVTEQFSTFNKMNAKPITSLRQSHVGSNSSEDSNMLRGIRKNPAHIQQHAVKEIVLNKALPSPKGCFTELTTLISEAEKSGAIEPPQQIPPPAHIVSPATSSRTGFMRIDASVKNQLPAQISIETHQSSNEHDKQIVELIDSIEKEKMNKSTDSMAITDDSNISINENIPKLVKMLESTEKSVESNETLENDETFTKDMDITHDLPEELLQLIDEDKSLQDAIEKEFLEDENNFINDNALNSEMATTSMIQQQQLPPRANTGSQSNVRTIQLIQPTQSPRTLPTAAVPVPMPSTSTAKSIIQMSISNTSGNSSPVLTSNSNFPRTSPLVRRDPIQIIRGNGRVITLPPIEAPTTRAKRRAQTTPNASPRAQHAIDNTPIIMNESSLDSSLHSNSSFSAASITLTSGLEANTSIIGKQQPSQPQQQQQQQTAREIVGKRRTSKEGVSGGVDVATVPKSAVKVSRRSVSSKTNSNSKRGKQDDAEASESQGDDDDPDKLWCICRQPHNNRFMICCDACGDWFHGTCVNVTKAMGREMEQKGVDWSCPQCIKKREDKKQRKLTDMLQSKRSMPQSSTADEKIEILTSHTPQSLSRKNSLTDNETRKISTVQQQLQTPTTAKKIPNVTSGPKKLIAIPSIALTNTTLTQAKNKSIVTSKGLHVIRVHTVNTAAPTTSSIATTNSTATSPSSSSTSAAPHSLCVFCKKVARPETVYCSDECIRRCAQNAINAYTAKSSVKGEATTTNINAIEEKKKKAKGLFEDFLAMPDRKPKVERITVYDRKNGVRLIGNNAPTTLTIKKWLQENPNYEIVLPGSQLSLELAQKLQQQQSLRTPVSTKTIGTIRISKPNMLSGTDINKTTLGTSQGSQKVVVISKESASAANQSPGSPVTPVRTIKQMIDDNKQGGSIGSSSRSGTPKQLQKYPQQVHIRSDSKSPRVDDIRSKERNLKRQNSDGSVASVSSTKKSTESSTSSPTGNTEPIRMNVRRTLKEQLLSRMNEALGKSSPSGKDEIGASTSMNLKLTNDEVESFVKEIEAEMYNLFNRDTGAKYKAKYRTLIFNIKDRKNLTLFSKICGKQIKPKQLVHMSPEELASQELAQWREKENKHQLEMIKKSELDLLSCTKNYLFKNHKGEEIIESKTSDVCVNLDMTIPVEDVVNVLNNSATGPEIEQNSAAESIGSDIEHIQSYSPREATSLSEQQDHHHQHHYEHSAEKSGDDKQRLNRERSRERDRRHRSKSRDSEKERGRTRDRDRDRRHRSRSHDDEKDRHRHNRDSFHRDKSRSKRRSHSHSRSRSRSQERRHRSKEERRDRERERDKKDKKGSTVKPSLISQTQSKDKHRNSPLTTASTSAKRSQTLQKPVECFSLVDQIIESSKTVEEAANLVKDSLKDKLKEKEKSKDLQYQSSPVTISTTTQDVSPSSSSATTARIHPQSSSTADSDQEPSSTVSIPTPPHDSYTRYTSGEEASFSRPSSPSTDFEMPPLWAGCISMNEVATLQMKLLHLIGNSQDIGTLLPENLEVVGRIDAETVWEYLWKIRKSPNKEIVLIHLMPSGENESDEFTKLFLYLDQKKRLGVIRSMTPQIKDFYIFPLGAGKQLPKVLQVTNHNDFYNDRYRSNMLIGIIVRVLGKHMMPQTSSSNVALTANVSSTAGKQLRRNRNEMSNFSPPGSPKRKKHTQKSVIDIDAIIKAPIVVKKSSTANTSALNDDADEPYSPGGSSDDDIVPMFAAKPSQVLLGLPSGDDELKRKMEEINRQIAAQEMEIAGLLNVEPSAASASVLANISIPSNLPQILASIKNIPNKENSNLNPSLVDSSRHMDGSEFEEYNPEELISGSPYAAGVRHTYQTSTAPSTSRLAQLSEAELLSMVPDDMMIETSQPTTSNSISSYYQEPPPPGV